MNALIYESSGELSRAWLIVSTLLRATIAAFFLFLAYKNLSGDLEMVEDFKRWGYSDGFRHLTALIQIVGALALIAPQTCFLGGLLLAGIMVGATVTHLLHDPPPAMISPLVFLLLISVSIAAFRPPLLR